MAEVQHTASGAGAPASAPPSVGAHYADAENGDQYIAHGATAADDWGAALARTGYALFFASGGSLAMDSWHALVEVMPNGAGPAEFTIEVPAVVDGGCRVFDVVINALDAESYVVLRTAGGGAFDHGGFIGDVPAGGRFEGGGLRLRMDQSYVLRVFVTKPTGAGTPPGFTVVNVAVVASHPLAG